MLLAARERRAGRVAATCGEAVPTAVGFAPGTRRPGEEAVEVAQLPVLA